MKGIYKIYREVKIGQKFDSVCKEAEKRELKALLFNDQVYIRCAIIGWLITPFTIDDFRSLDD